MTDEAFQSRNRQRQLDAPAFRDDPHLLALLDKLDALERATDPVRSSNVESKDRMATDALHAASELLSIVASWAVQHKVGLGYAGIRNLSELKREAATPDYAELAAESDRFEHERRGAMPAPDDAGCRVAVLNLLDGPLGFSLPEDLHRRFTNALDDVEFGVQPPMFTSENRSRKANTEMMWCRLLAHCFVEYEHARRNRRKVDLLSQVASEFSVSQETARNWLTPLREWNRFRVANAMNRARWAGVDAPDDRFDAIFGLEGLKRAAARHKAALYLMRASQSATSSD